MAGTTQGTIAVSTPAFAKRKARVLLGWLTEDEGALFLAERDIGAANDPAIRDTCRRARQAAAARPAVAVQQGIISPLPAGAARHVAALQAHPWGQRFLADVGQPALVDLTRVRAIQPTIHVEDARQRFAGIPAHDIESIAAVTIPVPPTDPPPLNAIFDAAKHAHIMASPSPNLRVLGPIGNWFIELSPGVRVPAFGFAVALLPSFLNVVGVGGRYFLRDGYHRAFGMLEAGILQAPALVREYGQLQEAGLNPGMLSPDVFLGDHAPLLPDYLDDAVSADTMAPLVTKMVVIQALEVTPLG